MSNDVHLPIGRVLQGARLIRTQNGLVHVLTQLVQQKGEHLGIETPIWEWSTYCGLSGTDEDAYRNDEAVTCILCMEAYDAR